MAETILVVDGEPDVRALARDALVSLGYVVLETGDPQHALRLAKEQSIHLLVVSDYPGRRAGVAARPSA